MVRKTGRKAWYYICDVSKREKVYEAAAKVEREAGEVTILVNNAGIIAGQKFINLKDDAIQKTMEVNALAHAWVMKSFYISFVTIDKCGFSASRLE